MRALAVGAACALGACAAGSSYMGIPLDAPVAAGPDAALRNLAARAQAGDKHAQLELGIAFEESRGVRRDLRKAERLYRLAATDSGGTMWVYTPPATPGERGRVMPLNQGPRNSGLAEAKRRLIALDTVRSGRQAGTPQQ
ncbi:MAG: SEL1-like repeat protein [Croceibacterium sp.]